MGEFVVMLGIWIQKEAKIIEGRSRNVAIGDEQVERVYNQAAEERKKLRNVRD
jgi:hypothetical protein